MQVTSRFFNATRTPSCRLFHHTPQLLASYRRTRPQNSSALQEDRHITPKVSSRTVVKHVISKLDRFLERELRMDNIEGYIHKTLDKALLSTAAHPKVYEDVIAYLIKNMWAQPAASVYHRMRKKGFITSDSIDARILAILLADVQGSPDLILSRMTEIVSKRDFEDDEFVVLLHVLEDYNVKPTFIVDIIQSFLCGKGDKYAPPFFVVASLVRAAARFGDPDLFGDIFKKGDWTIKLTAIAEVWGMADGLDGVQDKLVTRLVHAVADPAAKETDFLRSLAAMSEVDVNPQITARVCESFLANRAADYVPSLETLRAATIAFVQADRVDQAFALLGRVGIQPGHRPVHQAFLATLRDSRPFDHHSFVKLLSAMNDAGILIDTSILNILISREVRLKRVGQAWFLYTEMKKNPELLPDSYTFGSLFAMYRRIQPASLRQFSDAAEFTSPALPLRLLFKELVQSTERLEHPVKPNITLLNTALRAFIRQRDYVAAIVVIQSFERYQLPLDHKTYYCIVKLLVRRIWAEVQGSRPRDQVRWVDRFLGVQHYTEILLNRTLVHDIFTALRQKEFDISAPLYVPKRAGRRRFPTQQPPLSSDSPEAYYSFPTMLMMESVERPEPEDFIYEPIPLIRLLSRAAVAAGDVPLEGVAIRLEEWIRIAESDMLVGPSLKPKSPSRCLA